MNEPIVDITPENFSVVLSLYGLGYTTDKFQLNSANDLCYDYANSLGNFHNIIFALEDNDDPRTALTQYIENLKTYSEYSKDSVLPIFKGLQSQMNDSVELNESITITKLNKPHIEYLDERIENIKSSMSNSNNKIITFRDDIIPIIIEIVEFIKEGPEKAKTYLYKDLEQKISAYLTN